MDIPIKLRALSQFRALEGFRVVRFQDNGFSNPSPHWHILIRIPKEDFFLITTISSQYEKRVAHYSNTRKPKAINSLVKVSNDDFSFLSRPSVIDCNTAEYLNVHDIVHRLDENIGYEILEVTVPQYLQKDITLAIIRSPIISPHDQKKARLAHPS